MGGAHSKAQRWAGHIQRFSGGKCHRAFRFLLSSPPFFFLSESTLREFSWPWKFEWKKKSKNKTMKVFINILVKRTNQNKVLSSKIIETKLRQLSLCVFNRSISIRHGFISPPSTVSTGQVHFEETHPSMQTRYSRLYNSHTNVWM